MFSYYFAQTNLEQAENAIKQHESFVNTLDANDEKINQLLHSADKLAEEEHYAADKVREAASVVRTRESRISSSFHVTGQLLIWLTIIGLTAD